MRSLLAQIEALATKIDNQRTSIIFTLISNMCRFAAYLGAPIFLENVVIKPQHSLLRQSLRAEEVKSATNGDGFGLGWYGEKSEPALYREVMPAWSDDNLTSLCATVRSGLFFAHVRAATGTPVTRQNCHPFRHGRFMFMHNGQIGQYTQVRRSLESLLPDTLYSQRKGSTDSELMFFLGLNQMDSTRPVWLAVLKAFEQVREILRAARISAPLRFSAALADGEHLYAFRLSTDPHPPTLYRRDDHSGVVLASEPLDDDARWQLVPAGSILKLSSNGATEQLVA